MTNWTMYEELLEGIPAGIKTEAITVGAAFAAVRSETGAVVWFRPTASSCMVGRGVNRYAPIIPLRKKGFSGRPGPATLVGAMPTRAQAPSFSRR